MKLFLKVYEWFYTVTSLGLFIFFILGIVGFVIGHIFSIPDETQMLYFEIIFVISLAAIAFVVLQSVYYRFLKKDNNK